MKQIIDINHWKRKEHYNFFKGFPDPFFGITANVDCTKAYKFAKDNGLSFFLYYMYKSLIAVNAVEEFRCRIEGDNIVCFDKIHCSTTAMNANEMFSFAFLPYKDTFEEYYTEAHKEISKIKSIDHMNLGEDSGRLDVIHYSTIPWISFTGLTQEQSIIRPDSFPKLTFGKYYKDGNRLLLPLDVHVNHALMDGFHVGKHFEIFQELMND